MPIKGVIMKLKTPILPTSRTKPIRTRNILSKMHRRNELVVKLILQSITSKSRPLVNSDNNDDNSMSAEELLWLYGLIDAGLEVFTSPSNKAALESYLNQAFRQGWNYTNQSVTHQLENILDKSMYSLVETIPLGEKSAIEMLDVMIEENHDALKTILRQEVKKARQELKSVDECLNILKNARAKMIKRLDSSIGNEINMSARAARKAYTDVNTPGLKGITDEIEKASQGLNGGVLGTVDVSITDEEPQQEEVSFKLLWTSALLPTTRAWHASRHGHTYTQEEVDAFYAENGNSFNCHCSQDVVVEGLDKIPNKVLRRMADEKRKWMQEESAKAKGKGK